MLQQIIQFLMSQPDVLDKVREGSASLIGISDTERQAILDVFSNAKNITMSYWY